MRRQGLRPEVMKKSTHSFTAADVLNHQNRHGGVKCTCSAMWKRTHKGHNETCPMSLFAADTMTTAELERARKALKKAALPQPVKKTRVELEMEMILERQKRAREILDFRFQGMALFYCPDPETGILLRYRCDFVVFEGTDMKSATIRIVETKGHGKNAINSEAKLRFKACKASWPMFKFEMLQRARDGNWRRVL